MKFNLKNNFFLYHLLVLCLLIMASYAFIYFKTNRDILNENYKIVLENNSEMIKINNHESGENQIIFNQMKSIDILKSNIDSIFENQKIDIDNEKEIIFNQRQILFNQRQIIFNQKELLKK